MGTLKMVCFYAELEVGTMVKSIVEVFFRLLHYIVTLYLPVVFGAVASLEGFVLGFFNSGKNIDIFVVNINVQKLEDLVHHFGGSCK